MSPRMVPMQIDVLNTPQMVEIIATAGATIAAFDEEKDVCAEPLVAAIEQLRKSLEP